MYKNHLEGFTVDGSYNHKNKPASREGSKTGLVCSKCNVVFNDKSILREHDKKNHPLKHHPISEYQETITGFFSTQLSNYKLLFTTLQPDNNNATKNNTNQSILDLSKKVQASLDDKALTKEVKLNQHQTTYKRKTDKTDDLRKKSDQPGPCDKELAWSSPSMICLNREEEQQLYECNFQGCSYKSAYKGNLKRHFLGKHTKKKPYQCIECSQAYLSRYELKNHLIKHTGEQPYECNFEGCSYKSAYKRNLTAHSIRHREEKRYECSFGCGYKSAYKGNLIGHLARHTREKPHQCQQCFKSFAQRSGLSHHKKKCFINCSSGKASAKEGL